MAQQEQFAKIKALIPAMGTHLVALWATNFLPAEKELALLEEIGERFRKAKPNHPQVKPFLENLKRLKGVSIGSEAPEIALPTPAGPIMRLSDLRGKYVLIDFWASWCGPCRRENPNVIKTYATYKDKGFEIFGVSLDQEKTAWINAIAKDQLTWPHVSDLQYWNSVAAQAYQVSSIPMTFLLDPQGKVIAKGLRGDSLNQYLANLFSK
jgi:peroxiredoxin